MAKIKILHAEDDPITRVVIGRLIPHALEGREVEIDSCENGQELLERANQKIYHLYVTDHNMPRLNGLDALKELRRRGDKTPALLMSGGTDNLLDYQALEKVAYISKPIESITGLGSLLTKLLNESDGSNGRS